MAGALIYAVWDDAVAALLGVLLGAAIVAAVVYLLQWRRERRHARAAARVLQHELASFYRLVASALAQGEWPRVGIDLSTQLWFEHRYLLASVLSAEEWEAVAVAFYDARLLMRRGPLDFSARTPEVTEDEEEMLRAFSEHFQRAERVLSELAEVGPFRPVAA